MASFDNLMTMEPWAFRSAFGDSWFSDVISRETDTLTKVLQKSLSTPPPPPAAERFPGEMVLPVATPVQTPSASGPAGSGGSENETAVSKRRSVGPSGKISKRKSRAAKRATTTYITADVANFRQMVQQVTGVRFCGGGGGNPPVPHILKPEPHRAVNQLPPHTAGCLPTLDTSAFLLDHNNQKQEMTALIRRSTMTSPPPQPQPETVCDGGVTGFDFDSFSSFPTLESWN